MHLIIDFGGTGSRNGQSRHAIAKLLKQRYQAQIAYKIAAFKKQNLLKYLYTQNPKLASLKKELSEGIERKNDFTGSAYEKFYKKLVQLRNEVDALEKELIRNLSAEKIAEIQNLYSEEFKQLKQEIANIELENDNQLESAIDDTIAMQDTTPFLLNKNLDKRKIKIIAVDGCDHKQVCNAFLFPNLAEFAKRFVRKLFMPNTNRLTTTDLSSLKIGINVDGSVLTDLNSDEPITGITLCGYSRGAVTCFNVAKELNKLAPGIPINIVANQPVSGNAYQMVNTNATSVADCTQLKNLKNVSIILGAYTGETNSGIIDRTYHRSFFSQIVPRLPQTQNLNKQLVVLPRISHQDSFEGYMLGQNHLLKAVLTQLNRTNPDYIVNKDAISILENEIQKSYEENNTFTYPKPEDLQETFGISEKELYRHIDPLHPSKGKYSNEGRRWDEKIENIADWWQTRSKETNISFFKSSLTKQLEKIILEKNNSSNKSEEKYLALYQQAEKWLMLKEGTNSSRFYQVLAMRNSLHDLLSKIVKPQELTDLTKHALNETNYFYRQWKQLSSQASYFRTPETKALDKAFDKYAKMMGPSKDKDDFIITAIDKWLRKKEGGYSKRYEIVLRMREQLAEVIEKPYPEIINQFKQNSRT